MKFENNWKVKTLEILEKDVWEHSDSNYSLISKIYELRKIPLENLTIENLRIIISQEVGLNYLVPLAIEILREDLWVEGDYYEGDLLQSVLKIKVDFWTKNKEHWTSLNNLIKDSRGIMMDKKIDGSNFDKVNAFIN
jgi:hypothetical protein